MKSSLLIATLTLVGATLTTLLSPSASTSPPTEEVERQGELTAVRLDMDGTVYARLSIAGDSGSNGGNEGQELWFRSPPDRSEVISAERLLLALLLDAENDETITVVSEKDRTQKGTTPENAITILHVSRP